MAPLRILTALVGAFFALQGLHWLVNPAAAAAGLAMPLLDGMARSTQIGDLAAFFLATGTTAIVGSRPGRAQWLLAPAGILFTAALGRTIAFAAHGAELATTFIAVEVAAGAFLAFASTRLDARA
jgi:hypothetical protein